MALVAVKIFITILSFFSFLLSWPILSDSTVKRRVTVSRIDSHRSVSEDLDCRLQTEE